MLADFSYFGPRDPWLIAVSVVLFAFALSATIDAARTPGSAFNRADRLKWFWVVAPIAGGGLCFIGSLLAAVWWWAKVRPEVTAWNVRSPRLINGTDPAGWYPDPSSDHEARYFDGTAWTAHVSDSGTASLAPLGPMPPGLTEWFPPHIMMRSTGAWSASVAVAPEVSHASTMRTLSIAVAIVCWFPIGIFLGIAGAKGSRLARDAAETGDALTAARLLRRVRLQLIVAVSATVVWGVAYTAFWVTRGN